MVARTLVRVPVPMGVLVGVQAVQAAAPIAHRHAAEVQQEQHAQLVPMTVLLLAKKHVRVHAKILVRHHVKVHQLGNLLLEPLMVTNMLI